MRNFELMNEGLCRQWLALCAGFAQETLQLAGHAPRSDFVPFERDFFADRTSVAALGLLLQWACEDNSGYAETFRAVASGDAALCPFHSDGIDLAVNLVRNGINDDWEIFAHWGDKGYVVVREAERQASDRRFNSQWAPDWLYRRCGGARSPAELDPDVSAALHCRAIDLAVDVQEERAEAPSPAC